MVLKKEGRHYVVSSRLKSKLERALVPALPSHSIIRQLDTVFCR
jgi:hypothetical protein